jgi:hypothetical protein
LIYLDDNLISPETPNLANPHLLSPSAHSTPVNRTALLIPPNPSRPVTPDPPNTPRLGEYLAPGPLSRSPSIISDTASIIDSSVSFVQSGGFIISRLPFISHYSQSNYPQAIHSMSDRGVAWSSTLGLSSRSAVA